MHAIDLTSHWAGIASLFIFVAAYILVVFEEATHMRKSKPVMLAAGLIWALIGVAYMGMGDTQAAGLHAREIIEEYGELFLFLLVAITYVNTMEERRTFDVLRAKLIGMGLSYRKVIGDRIPGRAVVVSVLDNLTKGSSGQAIQNANLMLGIEETTGLMLAPVFP